MSQLGTSGNPVQSGFPANLLAFVGHFKSWKLHPLGILVDLPGGSLLICPRSYDSAYVRLVDEKHRAIVSPRIVSLTKKEAKKLEDEWRRLIFGPSSAPKKPKKGRKSR
jgi:hypothetical protein